MVDRISPKALKSLLAATQLEKMDAGAVGMSSSEKPQLTENEETGRFGADYVKRILKTGWRAILHPREGYADCGIDGTVIDQHRGRMTAIEFHIQIKTGTFAGDTFRAPLKRGHVELYRDSNVPVVLICVDVGPPPIAFWKLVRLEEPAEAIRMNKPIRITRQSVFGPDSRDTIIAEIQNAFPRRVPPTHGQILGFPIQLGVRDAAKDYYYRQLMPNPHWNPVFGPVKFTWKGWRHITRQARSRSKIPSSLLLLPCVRNILDTPVLPSRWRPLPPVVRGSMIQYRTLLIFERVVTFRHRAPAWVRVAVERQAALPTDWTASPPRDPRRKLEYKFLSVSELPRPVAPSDLAD